MFLFLFKQKTAYGMRISDWSSDVCSSDLLPRGLRSAAFDAEGVATRESALVADGVLQRYVLGSYSARRLGLATTANAGGVHNLEIVASGSAAHAGDLDAMLRGGRGPLVTELMGQGVNNIPGANSRGAAGFWVEDWAISPDVPGLPLAGTPPTLIPT